MNQPLVDIVAVEPGTMIHYQYDAGAGPVTIIGIKYPEAVGMARLGNQGFRIRTNSGDRYISRYAKVTVLA